MGLALLVVIWLITLVSTYFFIAKTWWLPVGAAASAGFIDRQFDLTYLLMGIVFLAAQLGLGYLAWKYRERASAPPADYSHGNTKLELVWTVLTAALFIGLNLMGSTVWAHERFDPAEGGAPVPCSLRGGAYRRRRGVAGEGDSGRSTRSAGGGKAIRNRGRFDRAEES